MAEGICNTSLEKRFSNSVDLEQPEQSEGCLVSTEKMCRLFSQPINLSLDPLIVNQSIKQAPLVDYVMRASTENPRFQHHRAVSLQPSLTLAQLLKSRLLLESQALMKEYTVQMMLAELATHQRLQVLQHEFLTISSQAHRILMSKGTLQDPHSFDFPSSWACAQQQDRLSPLISGASGVTRPCQRTGRACPTRTSKTPLQTSKNVHSARRVGRKWRVQCDKLVLYLARCRNHITPRSGQADRKLVSWVGEQRKQYKCFQQGIETPLTQARIYLLDKIGFVWNAHEAVWDKKMYELVSFYETYGTWTIPATDPEYRKLSLWVKEQRRQKRLMDQGRPSHITLDRIRRLEDAGFSFYPNGCC
jgi:hypothetical protein